MRLSRLAALSAAFVLSALSGCGGGGGSSAPPSQTPSVQFREFSVPVSGNIPDDPHPGCWPDDLVVDDSGSLWFAEHHADEIGRLIPSGNGYTYQGYPVPTHHAEMDSIALDGTRHQLWVSENVGNKMARLDLNASPPQVTEFPITTAAIPDPVPGDLALGADGSLWFTTPYEIFSNGRQDALGQLDAGTGQVQYFPTPTGTNGMDGIAVDRTGAVWFVELASNKIGRYAQGRFTEFMPPRPNAGPTNLALDAAGRVWVTEQIASAVAVFDPADTSGHPWREIPTATAASSPSGIAVDGTGNVWFTEITTGRIGLVPAGSSRAVDFPIPTLNSAPEDIVVAPSGRIFFTERYGNKVGEVILR